MKQTYEFRRFPRPVGCSRVQRRSVIHVEQCSQASSCGRTESVEMVKFSCSKLRTGTVCKEFTCRNKTFIKASVIRRWIRNESFFQTGHHWSANLSILE